MKNIFCCFTTLLFSLSIQSQTVIRGSANWTRPTIETMELDEATVRCYYRFIQKDKAGLMLTDTMTLDIGAKISEYYDMVKQKRDSALTNYFKTIDHNTVRSISVLKDQHSFDSESTESGFEIGRTGESSRLLKSRLTGEITIIDYIDAGQERYRFAETITPQAWQITTDTATILGYPCQKANAIFRGRNYEAWFSLEIPINDGPWKFFGLPGLIMKVIDSENLFSFQCVGIENLTIPQSIVMEQRQYIKCTRDELVKIKQKQSGGMRVTNNGGNIVIASKKGKDNYTPMELE